MRGFVIGVICFILVVAVGLVTVLVLGLTEVLPQFNLFNFDAGLKLANRQVFSASELDDLVVNYASDSIYLLPSETGEIVLEEYMTSWEDDMLAQVNQNGSRLSIQAGRRPLRIGISFWHARINIYVPAQWMGNLKLENSSGSIRSEDDFLLQAFVAKSNSGSIRLAGITAAADISLRASSGSVTANALQAGGAIQLGATSGSVKVESASGASIDAEASSGSLTAGQLQASGAVRLSTTSGSIKVESAGGDTVTAKASSGSLRFGWLEGEFSLENSSGSINVEDGKGHGRAQNSSGGIKVVLRELTGDVSLKTTSGSCKLGIPQSSSFYFEAETSSGSIKTPDPGALAYNQKGNQASGSFGSGPVYTVAMQASSGTVRLEWA